MTVHNLRRLDGIFAFSIVSGFTLSVLLYAGIDVSESGFALMLLQAFQRLFPPDQAWLIPVLGVVLPLIDLAYLANNIRQIAERGYAGAFASGTGFAGSLMVFLGAMFRIDGMPLAGFIVLIIGILGIRFLDDNTN